MSTLSFPLRSIGSICFRRQCNTRLPFPAFHVYLVKLLVKNLHFFVERRVGANEEDVDTLSYENTSVSKAASGRVCIRAHLQFRCPYTHASVSMGIPGREAARRDWMLSTIQHQEENRDKEMTSFQVSLTHMYPCRQGVISHCSISLHASQVMVSNIDFDLTEKDVEKFCSEAGEVVAVKLIRKRNSRKSKG